MRPYKQGNFHRTCCLFAIINGVKLAGVKMKLNEAQCFFDFLTEVLVDEELLSEVMLNGCGRECLEILLERSNNYLQKEYNIELKSTRIFWNEKLSGKELCKYIQDIGVVLVRVKCPEENIDHYTIIKSIDSEYIHFFDSDGLPKIKIEKTSTEAGKTKYQILIRQLYALQLVKNECS